MRVESRNRTGAGAVWLDVPEQFVERNRSMTLTPPSLPYLPPPPPPPLSHSPMPWGAPREAWGNPTRCVCVCLCVCVGVCVCVLNPGLSADNSCLFGYLCFPYLISQSHTQTGNVFNDFGGLWSNCFETKFVIHDMPSYIYINIYIYMYSVTYRVCC